MILITYDKSFDKINGVVCLYLDKNTNKFTLGRSENNDIVFDDVSVSRNHAIIFKKKRKVFIKDLKSKFGTHLLVKRSIFPKLFTDVHL